MKFTLLISFLFACISGLCQENITTRADLLKILNSILSEGKNKQAIGIVEGQVLHASFTTTGYFYKVGNNAGNAGYVNYEGIQWEQLIEDGFTVQSGHVLTIRFQKSFNRKSQSRKNPETNSVSSQLKVFIPPAKVESFKQTCIQLARLDRETNTNK